MKTVNSLSGGKTSGYLAAHYPADIDIFALVCIESHNAGVVFKKDPKLRQMINDRLEKSGCLQAWGEFVATSEDPQTVRTIFELEQFIGREITWVRGMGWESLITQQHAIPNRVRRFCSFWLKIVPIFTYLHLYHELPVKMRIGYRYDEIERMGSFTTDIKVVTQMSYRGNRNGWRYPRRDGWVKNWTQFKDWREGDFPLIDDKINHWRVQGFWKDKPVTFPLDSNCQNCFWKHEQQLRKNFDTNPGIMYWAGIQEHLLGHTFRDEHSLLQIARMSLQSDFNFGTGSGCQAGGCTD